MDSHRLARVHWLHTTSKAKYIVIHFYFYVLGVIRYQKTRMHSSRMRTARSSSHHGGSLHTPPPQSMYPHPLEQAPPWLDPPQLPPWVWTWRPSSGQIPLGCGPENLQGMLRYHASPLETCCKACWDTTCNACWDSPPQQNSWHTLLKILPCPKLRLRAVTKPVNVFRHNFDISMLDFPFNIVDYWLLAMRNAHLHLWNRIQM